MKTKVCHFVHHTLFVALMQCTIFESPHSSELCADQMKFAWNGLSYLVDEREQFPAVSFSKTSLDFRATRRDFTFFDMTVSKGEKYVAPCHVDAGPCRLPPPRLRGVVKTVTVFGSNTLPHVNTLRLVNYVMPTHKVLSGCFSINSLNINSKPGSPFL